MRPAILFLGRSGGYYYEKAWRREEALQYSLAGDGGWLNLTRAVGKLQTSHAHHSMQNDLAHSTGSARLLGNDCVWSYGRKTVCTCACCGRFFDDNSSWLHARRVWSFKSKQKHAIHRSGATRVYKLSRIMTLIEKYRFVQFCIFCVG